MPDIGRSDVLDAGARGGAGGGDLPLRHGRDYLPAAINVLRREGVEWPCGYKIRVESRIPINSGASSSSALQVAWIAFLMAAAGEPRASDPIFIARMAHRSEVVEFGSPGGMMDHYSSALGGLVYIDCRDPAVPTAISSHPGPFVLIDSKTPKDTNAVLGRVRGAVAEAFEMAGVSYRDIPARIQDLADHAPWADAPDSPAGRYLRATAENYQITQSARKLLGEQRQALDFARLGQLLNEHHQCLSEDLHVSTPLIDSLLERGRAAGAFGGKINGSGGGGSWFLLTPETLAEKLASNYRASGYPAFVVRTGPGVRVDQET